MVIYICHTTTGHLLFCFSKLPTFALLSSIPTQAQPDFMLLNGMEHILHILGLLLGY